MLNSMKILLVIPTIITLCQSIGAQTMRMAPDLVLKDFRVTSLGEQVNNKVKYRFEVVIKNIGNGMIYNDYYLSIQQKVEGAATFSNSQNCYPIRKEMEQNSKKITRYMELNAHWVSNKTVEVRAWVDSGCNREITLPGIDIKELNENNNFSNTVTVGGTFTPHASSVSPPHPVNFYYYDSNQGRLVQNDIALLGTGFGISQGGHTIGIKPAEGGEIIKTKIKQWHHGMIYFNIPKRVPIGPYQVFLMDKNSLVQKSNAVPMFVCHKTKLHWRNIQSQWNALYKHIMTIKIDNWNGEKDGYLRDLLEDSCSFGFGPVSESIRITPIRLYVKRLGTYVFLINELNSQGDVVLSRNSNKPISHLSLNIPFESSGVEVKGFFRRLQGKTETHLRKFHDVGCPDVEINNLRVRVDLNITFSGGKLNYSPDSRVIADIRLHNRSINHLANEFSNGWDSDVKVKIENSINASLGKDTIKTNLTDAFIQIFAQVGSQFKAHYIITGMEFMNQYIDISYYKP